MTTESDRSHALEACPNKAQHTPQPDGYLEWHDWAERMTKTHRQIQCDGCKLWAIWVPK